MRRTVWIDGQPYRGRSKAKKRARRRVREHRKLYVTAMGSHERWLWDGSSELSPANCWIVLDHNGMRLAWE
jgi:hypothetical protein